MPTDEMIFGPETLALPLLTTDDVGYRRTLDLVLAHVDPVANLQPVGAALRQRLLHSLHGAIRTSRSWRGHGDVDAHAPASARLRGHQLRESPRSGPPRSGAAASGQPTISTCELAGLVGFTEPSPFFRAFRRWFDCTPGQWRHKHHIL